MDGNKKFSKDDAYKALELTNSWIFNVDGKISFGLAFSAILIGIVFASEAIGLRPIGELFSSIQNGAITLTHIIEAILAFALYSTSFLSLVMFFIALKGRVKNDSGKSSIMFFGSVASEILNNYKAKVLNMSEKEVIKDILEQVHTNSKICTQKFKYYNYGLKILIGSVFMYFVSLLYYSC